ncbi:MAG: methenyltetrahydromethanopterin cyclohydrolase [Planctomycetaceae bacterium]|nr:methenyltetrahydromethanopterin cyclohydrolase [Planctomycetaceae bacterium]
MQLNRLALQASQRLFDAAELLRIEQHRIGGACVLDCGIDVPGSVEAGRLLSLVTLSGLGRVEVVPGPPTIAGGPFVQVTTDQPVAGCMASQYAGWEIREGDFFAMGSGPMRAAANREKIFEDIGYAEKPNCAVGVLETGRFPGADVVQSIAAACHVKPVDLVLLLAPTASQAGTLQVVARSVETALHKLYELGFDLDRIESGWGLAPLPPVAPDDLSAIGRTNDAILYGGQVTLWVRGDDASLEAIGPQIPSCSSSDHGQTFAEIFARYEHDFYKIDPHLFSPARIRLVNLDSGQSFSFGDTLPGVLQSSFGD